MGEQIQNIRDAAEGLSTLVAPAAIIFGGLVLSLLAGWAVAVLVRRTGADAKLATLLSEDETAPKPGFAKLAGRITFWVGILLTLVAFLNYAQLDGAAAPLNALLAEILQYAPRVLGAALILLAAYVVARLLRYLIVTGLGKTQIDARVSEQLAEDEGQDKLIPVSKTLGDTVYWLVFLLFLPAALGALQLKGLLDPVSGMFQTFLGFLPSLVSAGLILFVGWVVARLVQRILTNLSNAAGVDRLSEKVGVQKALGKQKLSNLIGVVAHILIILPVAIAALDALNIDSITRPASQMLGMLLNALPSIFAAGLVVIVSYFIGRAVAELVTNLLSSAGFDNVLVKLGLTEEGADTERRPPSNIGGDIVMIAIMLFAFVEAASLLGFGNLALLTTELMELGGHILLGLAIIALGLYLGKAAAGVIERSQIKRSDLLAVLARLAILILAGAMGLRQMGIANEIIVTAFSLTLGALAVAFALAFGLGGRDEAADQLKEWRRKLDKRDTSAERGKLAE
jgi:hypothetical protein